MSGPDILFVASNRNPELFRHDPSFVYRCENLGLALTELGLKVDYRHLTALPTRKVVRVAVFHRPIASSRLWYLLRKLRQHGVKVLADFDDLIFDESLASFSPGVLNSLVPYWKTWWRFLSHRTAMSWFDGITVSTEPLADHAHGMSPSLQVMQLHNCVHHSWRNASEQADRIVREKVITYFPGTRSHDRDFAEIAGPLSRFLYGHPEVRLEITGRGDFAIDARLGQVRHQERLSFSEYQSRVQSGWVNIAPLENTPFNQAKSALKIMEAGYWGVPTLCSPNADNRRFSAAGAVIAEHGEQWHDHLERLLMPEEYQAVTVELQEKITALADVYQQARRFTDCWLSTGC